MSKSLAEQILERSDAVIQLAYMQKVLKEEKERRIQFRNWITEDVKAEFINGETIMHSPVRRKHWQISAFLSRLLGIYVSLKGLGEIGTEKVMIGLSRNDYEPDIVFFSKEKAAQFTADQMIFPAPAFVVEILSKSTAKFDLTVKKDDYALHGIKEYWIIDPDEKIVSQYILSKGEKSFLAPKKYTLREDIKSEAIPGFEIPVAAIFDEQINLKILKSFAS